MESGLKPYMDVKKSDLFLFFKCTEVKREKSNTGIIVTLQPGAYQEFIELILQMDDKETILEAELRLARSWIGDKRSLNVFANDIAKSFMYELVPLEDKDVMHIVSEALFYMRGEDDKALSWDKDTPDISLPESIVTDVLKVYTGEIEAGRLELSNSTVLLSNTILGETETLVIRILRDVDY